MWASGDHDSTYSRSPCPGHRTQTQKQEKGNGDCHEEDLFSPQTHSNKWEKWDMSPLGKCLMQPELDLLVQELTLDGTASGPGQTEFPEYVTVRFKTRAFPGKQGHVLYSHGYSL